jgi:hypothetical protein
MFPAVLAGPSRAALLLLALAACEEAQGVDVQPLPQLQRPSPEKRAGLPEVSGTWRFAGWELPVRDTVTGGEGMLAPGALAVRTQRLDSVAGAYVRDGQQFPFVGEVRRDGILSVVAFGPDGAGSFIAGRVLRDTLWIELTSLSAAQTWSTGARAAMVRTAVRQPFVRYQGGFVKVNVDSIRADSVRRDSLRLADSVLMADSLRLTDSLRLADSAAAGVVPGQPVPLPGQVPGQPGVRPGAPPAAVPGQPGVRPAAPPAATPGQARPPAAQPRPPAAQPQRPAPTTGTQPPRTQQQTPRAAPKQQAPTEAQRRRTQEAERRRLEEAAERRREQDASPREEPKREEPARPRPDTTTRRPAPVIIP